MKIFVVFFISTLLYCNDAVIQTPLVIDGEKIKKNCEVEKVLLAYADDTVAVSWLPVNSSCALNPEYKIQYKIDDTLPGVSDPISPEIQMAMVPFPTLRCERVFLTVCVVENGTVIGKSNEVELERELDSLLELSVAEANNTVLVKWKPLDLGASCEVTYSLLYTVDNKTTEERDLKTSEFLVPITNDKACVPYDIQVYANSNNLTSKPVAIRYEIGIPPVRDAEIKNRDDQVIINFKPPTDIPKECGDVDYKVIQTDEKCYNTSVTITPVSSVGYEGVVTKKTITRKPGNIRNLDASIADDKVYLSWQAPYGATDCNMIYFLSYADKTYSVHATFFIALLQLQACKGDPVQIAPAIIVGHDYVEGQRTDMELIGELEAVRDLNCSLKFNVVECEWKRPSRADYCKKIIYLITYYDGDEKQKRRIEDTYFEFEINDAICSFWFNVQPLAYVVEKKWEGDVLEAVIDGCEGQITAIEEPEKD